MIRFANLYQQLDSTTKTSEKVDALVEYFASAHAGDAAWATFFLAGNRLKKLVPTKRLRQWAAEEAKIPNWLFEESYHSVGDLAETISLLIPSSQDQVDQPLRDWVNQDLKLLGNLEEVDQKKKIQEIWRSTSQGTRFVLMKLVTGGLRVGVSRGLLIRSLAKHSGVSKDVIAHRLMGHWEPSSDTFQQLINLDESDSQTSRPYPFCLAHPLPKTTNPSELGCVKQFAAEWKWDGIRGQVIRRQSQTFLWSRGELLMDNTWPEIEAVADSLPNGTVIDGEILAATPAGNVLPFDQLQRRIGRKKVGKKLMTEVPVTFYAFDLLEWEGNDIREQAFKDRRHLLQRVLDNLQHPHLRITELIEGESWEQLTKVRQSSRVNLAEGLMLKRLEAPYSVGRAQGTWWKWKVDPHTIDAVLIYAQKGHGKRANLFSDYTFAVWDQENLVPFAKAYSGLNDQEIRQVDRFVRSHTNDAFGPVRQVEPEIVMEIAFEGLRISKRHKCGVATRFPRMIRWRHDKQPKDANTLQDLQALLNHQEESHVE